MSVIENRIEAAGEMLQKADRVARKLEDASKGIGSLIIACGYLMEVIEEQQGRIEHLEDILQDQLEGNPYQVGRRP